MRRRTAFVGAIVALILGLGAGAAFAFFTSHASGTGSGSTGTLQPVTVVALAGGDSPNSSLLPGGPAADVILRVSNPNSYAVTLISVAGGPGSITADAGHPLCTTTGVSFSNQSALNVNLVANTTTLVHLPGAATMSTSSSNGCQGATFSIPVTITVQKG